MRRHIISILVENQSGVLTRITGLFSRRGYNIDSLSVGVTQNPAYSRITIVVMEDDETIEQIERQVNKLVDVVEVVELHQDDSVYRELALVKINVKASMRSEIYSIVEIFRANIIDVSQDIITVEITGDQSKIAAFSQLVEPYGIKEIVRTGLTGLERGNRTIQEYNNKTEE